MLKIFWFYVGTRREWNAGACSIQLMKCTFDLEPIKPLELQQRNEAQEKVENSKEKELSNH